MKSSLDPTKLKGYRPEWSYHPPPEPQRVLVPRRHLCGEIVQADITSEYVLFYPRYNVKGEGSPITSCPLCGGGLDMEYMRALYLVEPMPSDLAIHTMAKVCSNCWGWQWEVHYGVPVYDEDGLQIAIRHDLVLCKSCLEETRGYVTQRYVGYAREKDGLDYGRALNGLIEALELDQEGMPVQVETIKNSREALAELGF